MYIKKFFLSIKTKGFIETLKVTKNFLNFKFNASKNIKKSNSKSSRDVTTSNSVSSFKKTTGKCIICGHNQFAGGPGGRSAQSGKAPRCLKCNSLERHRIFRNIFNRIREHHDFKMFNCLQFSGDLSTDASWFKSFTCSIYGKTNSLDLQKIDKPSSTYDLVICNHVLEHVPYDNSALNEMGRIIKSDGFVFLSFPEPLVRKNTSDWGFPRDDQHGHYRVYGMDDVLKLFKKFIPHMYVLSIIGLDKITDTKDVIFFLCKSKNGVEKITNVFANTKTLQEPEF